jgi:hypothetical protein
MANNSGPADVKPKKKDAADTAAKLAAHKIEDELNPHHQKAKPKGKK